MLAYLSRTNFAIKQIEKLSWDWIKMDCSGGKCYGLLAVSISRPGCVALMMTEPPVHAGPSILLCVGCVPPHALGRPDRRQVDENKASCHSKRVSTTLRFKQRVPLTSQNSWWGPKVLLYFVLCFLSFLIPNGFFMFYGTYIAPIGSFLFILIGLVLLVDFAHSWSETCLDRWETSESNLWQFILVGSTFGMYIAAIALTIILYIFFAGSGCGLNTFFITFNLALSAIATLLSISPPVQEVNPKSGLAQASMVTAYCTYLTASAVANHNDEHHGVCNPIHRDGTKTTTVLLGALFTFLAIAYSTSRAATQSKALAGKKGTSTGPIALPADDDEVHAEGENTGHVRLVTNQPKARKDQMRYDAIKAAVDAG